MFAKVGGSPLAPLQPLGQAGRGRPGLPLRAPRSRSVRSSSPLAFRGAGRGAPGARGAFLRPLPSPRGPRPRRCPEPGARCPGGGGGAPVMPASPRPAPPPVPVELGSLTDSRSPPAGGRAEGSGESHAQPAAAPLGPARGRGGAGWAPRAASGSRPAGDEARGALAPQPLSRGRGLGRGQGQGWGQGWGQGQRPRSPLAPCSGAAPRHSGAGTGNYKRRESRVFPSALCFVLFLQPLLVAATQSSMKAGSGLLPGDGDPQTGPLKVERLAAGG